MKLQDVGCPYGKMRINIIGMNDISYFYFSGHGLFNFVEQSQRIGKVCK